MATTAAQAWDALSESERDIGCGSRYSAFLTGFEKGWQAQENRPFFCTYCGVEIIGATNAETILKAQDHTRQCDVHPLAIENRRLRDALDFYGDHSETACTLTNADRCVCGLDEAKR